MNNIIKIILIYILVYVLFGYLRNDILISTLPDTIHNLAKFSAFISLIVMSIIIPLVIILVFLFSWFALALFGSNIKLIDLLQNIWIVFIVLFLSEPVKYFVLRSTYEQPELTAQINVENLLTGPWFNYIFWINLIFVSISAISLGFVLFKRYDLSKELYIPLGVYLLVMIPLQLF